MKLSYFAFVFLFIVSSACADFLYIDNDWTLTIALPERGLLNEAHYLAAIHFYTNSGEKKEWPHEQISALFEKFGIQALGTYKANTIDVEVPKSTEFGFESITHYRYLRVPLNQQSLQLLGIASILLEVRQVAASASPKFVKASFDVGRDTLSVQFTD